ncbi:hypothetical protein F4553_006989 [Allocatelliglobosispora scoriae]|uniref:Novel toxin 17 domain-containing protein n=1 Tax=Allocatelliglobosispora scoriae TaxID=643052 RepID=A0A841C0U7_9ACTN|nr:polymorphic toxin type 17 domain-containing protein [Allocatelliglobosispora scoriae]MBB5873555.1 hypothetical protein [Allocatelliglobosispora scoriae]
MGLYIGADPDRLDLLAGQLRAGADSLDVLGSTISGALYHGGWEGDDAELMRSDWQTALLPALGTAATLLRTQSEALLRNAQEQRRASTADADSAASPDDLEIAELTSEGALGATDLVVLIADIVGIFDPTPISDGVSGVISLFRGDWGGAGLSALSMIPYAGDLFGKGGKLAKLLARFEHLPLDKLDDITNTLRKIDYTNPAKVNEALGKLNKLAGDAAKRYENPRFQAGADRLELPTDGPIPFVPPKRWQPENPQSEMVGGQKGYRDDYGNLWVKGPGRGGDAWEWDVQPGHSSGTLQDVFGDGTHVNVSRDGQLTHNPGGGRR